MRKAIAEQFKKLMSNKIFLSSSMISIISVCAGVVNFFVTFIVGMILGKEQYGVIKPLISLLLVVSIPGMALQMVFSKDISYMVHHKDMNTLRHYLKKISGLIAFFIIILVGFLFIMLPFLKGYFHVQDNNVFYLLIILAALMLIIIPFNSMIQSREDYKTYIIYSLITTFSKAVFWISLVYLLANYFGVLFGMILTIIASLVFLFTDYKSYKKKNMIEPGEVLNKDIIKTANILKSFLNSLLSIFFFNLIIYLDTMLVLHYLPEVSGIYSMVNQFGQASFFIASSISFVMLPIMAKDKANIVRSNQKAFLFLFMVLVAYCSFLALTSNFISVTLFGNKFAGMEKILPLYGFMFLPFALISFLVNYYVISEKLFYSITLFAGSLLLYFGVMVFHKDLIQVSLVVGAVGYLTLIILVIESFFWHKGKKMLDKVQPDHEKLE